MTITKVANMSTPASIGIEFTADDGTVIQLAVPRGTSSVIFGMKRSDGNGWTPPMVVDAPERFGTIPTTFKQLHAYAERFSARPEQED